VASPLGGSTEAEREAWLDEVGRVADAL
jgi:hypothetical protein